MWTYADWDQQPTDAAKLQRLLQHLAEVRQQITLSISSDGKSKNSATVLSYYESLKQDRDRLEAVVGTGSAVVTCIPTRSR